MKPLGIKNYGSIGHLPNSRMGPSDHHVHEGQAVICTKKARDRHDVVIVTEGERCVGEWMAQAHGTRYKLQHEPFVIFDIIRGHKRAPWNEVHDRCALNGFTTPKLLSMGMPVSVEKMMGLIDATGGAHGAIDQVEGAVWRVERNGQFDFMAKYVRPEKQDGKYLPEISQQEALWNWKP